MRLASAVLGFLVRKLGVFLAVLAVLFLGLVVTSTLVPTLKKAEAQRDRLAQVAEERQSLRADLVAQRRDYQAAQSEAVRALTTKVRAEIDQRRAAADGNQSVVDKRRKDRDKACKLFDRLIDKFTPLTTKCLVKQKLYDAAVAAQARLERAITQAQDDAAVLADPQLSDEQKLARLHASGQFDRVDAQIRSTQSKLDRATAEEKRLRDAQHSWSGWLVGLWDRSWKYLVATAALILVLPALLRTLSYFVLMPLLTRAHTPMRLAADDEEHSLASVDAGRAQRTLTVQLAPGQVLSARSEHVRSVGGRARSRLLFDPSAPFISFAAGLHGLSRITGDREGTSATLTTADDTGSYLMRIDFEDHPGLVMHPRHVIGVIGEPELTTRWRWGVLAFARGQLRYIMFTGTGSLIVQGSGDVAVENPGGKSARMEQSLVMGFDSRLIVGFNRTEVFLPYLRGRKPLVDDEFTGRHPVFWQSSATGGHKNPVAKTFDAIFSAIGKVLGF